MRPDTPTVSASSFQSGERVYLFEGPYQGTTGAFVGLCPDTAWAHVHEEARDQTLSHPVAWLRRCPEGELNWTELLSSK